MLGLVDAPRAPPSPLAVCTTHAPADGWTVGGAVIISGVDVGAELTACAREGVAGVSGASMSGVGSRQRTPFAGARIEGPFAIQGFQVGMWSSRRHRCLAVLVLDDMLVVLVDVTQVDDDSTPAKGRIALPSLPCSLRRSAGTSRLVRSPSWHHPCDESPQRRLSASRPL